MNDSHQLALSPFKPTNLTVDGLVSKLKECLDNFQKNLAQQNYFEALVFCVMAFEYGMELIKKDKKQGADDLVSKLIENIQSLPNLFETGDALANNLDVLSYISAQIFGNSGAVLYAIASLSFAFLAANGCSNFKPQKPIQDDEKRKHIPPFLAQLASYDTKPITELFDQEVFSNGTKLNEIYHTNTFAPAKSLFILVENINRINRINSRANLIFVDFKDLAAPSEPSSLPASNASVKVSSKQFTLETAVQNQNNRATKMTKVKFGADLEREIRAMMHDESQLLVLDYNLAIAAYKRKLLPKDKLEPFLSKTSEKLGFINKKLYLENTLSSQQEIVVDNSEFRSKFSKMMDISANSNDSFEKLFQDSVLKDINAIQDYKELTSLANIDLSLQAMWKNEVTNKSSDHEKQNGFLKYLPKLKKNIKKPSWFAQLFDPQAAEKRKMANGLEKKLDEVLFRQHFLSQLWLLSEGKQTIETTLDNLRELVDKNKPSAFSRFFGSKTPDYVIKAEEVIIALSNKYRSNTFTAADARFNALNISLSDNSITREQMVKSVLDAVQPNNYQNDKTGLTRLGRHRSGQKLAKSLNSAISSNKKELPTEKLKGEVLKQTREHLVDRLKRISR